jgi:putative DNA primase/helicase
MRKTLLTQSESAPLSDLWFDAVPLHNPLDPMLSGRSAATDMRRPNCQLVIDAHGDLSNHVIVRLEDSTGATSSLAHLPDDYHERPNAKIIYMPKGYPLGAMMIGDDDAPIMWLCATIQDAWAIHRSSTMPTFCAVYFTDSNRAHIINAYAKKRRMAYCIDSVERESQQQPTAKTPVIDQRFVQLVDVSARPAMAIEFGEDIGKQIDQVIYAADMARAELPHAPTIGAPPAFGAWTPDLMLERVSLIYGTDTVWDDINRIQIKLSHLRHATGKTLYDGWIDNPQRRIVKGLVFDPSEQQIDRYTINLFSGLPPQTYNAKASCKHILGHLLRLCGGRGAEFEWLIKWIAYPLQNMGAKMDSGVIMYGSEGPGKSVLWEHVIGRIYGDYAITIGQSQLESQFTSWQSGKLFALCEEVVSRTERNQHKGQLKHLVTGRTLLINEKSMPLREESNHLNFVFLSNSTIPLELDMGDRRYLVLYCGDVPDKTYFDQLFNEINADGVAAFYHHLMQLDLGDFNAHAKPPLNVDKQQLIEASLPNPVLFYNDWAAGDLDIPFTSCTKSDLFNAYRRWCTQRNEYPKRDRDLTAELRRYMIDDRKDIHYPTTSAPKKTVRVWITPDDQKMLREQADGLTRLQNLINMFSYRAKPQDDEDF